MKKLILLISTMFLSGCVSMSVKHVPIAGEDYTYVFTKNSNGVSSLFTCDRYDNEGNCIIHDSTSGSDPLGSFISELSTKSSGLLLAAPHRKINPTK